MGLWVIREQFCSMCGKKRTCEYLAAIRGKLWQCSHSILSGKMYKDIHPSIIWCYDVEGNFNILLWESKYINMIGA